MNKRELINALEACPLPDDTKIQKTSWEFNTPGDPVLKIVSVSKLEIAVDKFGIYSDGKHIPNNTPVIRL